MAKPARASMPDRLYGELREGLHITGYTFERAMHRLEALLENSAFKQCGFKDVNEFLESLRFDEFRVVAEQRKRIALRIKQLQPKATIRQIARTLGVDKNTIAEDIGGENSPASRKKLKQINEAGNDSGEFSPLELSGTEAASLARRADSKAAAARE